MIRPSALPRVGMSAARAVPLLIATIALAVLFAIVFVPPLRAGFMSDAYIGLERAKTTPLHELLAYYIPSPTTWYRPTTVLVQALEYRAFGMNPIGYHVVALVSHMVTAGLIWTFVRRLNGTTLGAVAAAMMFLFLPQAHEPLWDVADLHTVLSAPLLLGAVVAYAQRRSAIALLLTAISLTVDEAGLLVGAFVLLYEGIFGGSFRRDDVVRAAKRVAPFVVLGVAYVAMRAVVGVWSEVGTLCRDQGCLMTAVSEYLDRLFGRPDTFVSVIQTEPWAFALVCVVVAQLAFMLHPWDWTERRPTVFAAGWVILASLFFILTLWPYVADRFFYLPGIGLAMLVGLAAGSAFRLWRASEREHQVRLMAVAAIGLIWLVLGMAMLVDRGRAWITAGDEATAIVDGVVRILPDPPPGSVLVFVTVPDSLVPPIPPGDSGPYVFRNGLASALRLAYGHGGFTVLKGEVPADAARNAFVFGINEGVVSVLGPASAMRISGLESPRLAGTRGSIRVTVLDAGGNLVRFYRGTVHFTSTDQNAALPGDYTFTAADAGTHVFDGLVILRTVGNHTLSATDSHDPSIVGDAMIVVQ